MLLAVPISLVTVPSELTGYTKVLPVLPTGGMFQMVVTFLFVLGLVMIQGILLPELSRRLLRRRCGGPVQSDQAKTRPSFLYNLRWFQPHRASQQSRRRGSERHPERRAFDWASRAASWTQIPVGRLPQWQADPACELGSAV